MKDSKGKFIETTGSTRYKRKEKNGINMQHSRYVWEQHNGPIPNGYLIHHINENKKDDRLENLKMMTSKEHNRLHHAGHTPWNKGKICPKISKSKIGHKVSKEQIKKTKGTWKNKYLESMLEINNLKEKGHDYSKIANIVNETKDCVIGRHRKFIKDYAQECDLI